MMFKIKTSNQIGIEIKILYIFKTRVLTYYLIQIETRITI